MLTLIYLYIHYNYKMMKLVFKMLIYTCFIPLKIVKYIINK